MPQGDPIGYAPEAIQPFLRFLFGQGALQQAGGQTGPASPSPVSTGGMTPDQLRAKQAETQAMADQARMSEKAALAVIGTPKRTRKRTK